MKQRLLFLMLVSTMIVKAQSSQAVPLVHYVLDSFTNGKVLMKSGTSSEQKMNYNILTGEMIFIDNGKFLAIATPEEVDTVFIAQRKFVPVEGHFYEWLAGIQPALLKEYSSTIEEPKTETGFGSTNTTAANSLKQLIRSGGAYELKLPDDFKFIPKNSYWVEKDKRLYKVTNVKQLINLYPAKKSWIEDWWKQHDARFSKQEDLVALVTAMQ